jgi:hypothetical protein
MGALEAVEADVQILRVCRQWSAEGYAAELQDETTWTEAEHGVPRTRYIEEHARRLAGVGAGQAVIFLLVSLREPERDVASYLSKAVSATPRAWRDWIGRAVALRDRRLLRLSELEAFRQRADQVHACLVDYLQVRQSRGVELQWLIRRAFCRGLGEPSVDALHEPRALTFESNGEAVLAPLEGDIMRCWGEGYVEDLGRLLKVESELGTSWQAQLVVGALPESVPFPSSRAELMFAPPESLPFGVDLSLNARFLPNALALRVARRKIQDADQIVRAESDGDQGITDLGYERTQEARDLLAYLQSSSRPPLLRTTIAIAVSATGRDELEERVQMCRRAFGEIRLHRPVGDQLQLFSSISPGSAHALRDTTTR